MAPMLEVAPEHTRQLLLEGPARVKEGREGKVRSGEDGREGKRKKGEALEPGWIRGWKWEEGALCVCVCVCVRV